MTLSVFSFPNRILFGAGSRRMLPRELEQLGIQHPLVVSDPGVVSAGLLADFPEKCAGWKRFTEVQPNPTEEDVLRGLDVMARSGCDGLVAIGGGSVIDAAKGIRLLFTHPGRLADYDVTTGGIDRITSALPSLIAVPTTAGTGSEVGRAALIQLEQTGRKTAILSPHLLPSVAICDPDLTLKLPPELTASTGMDAVTHAVESYCSTQFHPICDGIALEALRHLARGLETVVQDGANAAARHEMMLGALLAGISFHKGLGAVHALAHALGSRGRAHHGSLCAILLPHVLRFNRDACTERLTELAGTLGLGRSGDAPGHLMTVMTLLRSRFPIPQRLREIPGVRRDELRHYAHLAMRDHTLATNPRPATEGELEQILVEAW
jgi:alcohol dehydrogenase class IV